jgi:hypothetical protein
LLLVLQLHSIRTSGRTDTSFGQCQIGQLVVLATVRRRLKVIVVLMVHFGAVKGKLCRIVHVDNLFAQRIGVVAFTGDQCKAGLFRFLFNARIDGGLETSGNSKETAVFASTVPGIDAVYC